jgi:hypothetical protein
MATPQMMALDQALAAKGTLLTRARQASSTAGAPSGAAAAGHGTAGRL